MKFYGSQVVVLLNIGFWSVSSLAQTLSLSVPVEFQFLNRGDGPIDGQFFIRAGQIFVRNVDGTETLSTLSPLSGPRTAAFTGAAEAILGAPVAVLARREVAIPAVLENAKATLRAAVKPASILFVQETRAIAPNNQVITNFTVSQLVGDELTELGKFSFRENTYNQYLSEVWPISDDVLAIVTKSSRHSRLNTFFMFDTKKRQLVGMREFSLIQYIPSSSSVWIANSVANCDNSEEIFVEAKSKARLFKLFDGNGIMSDFQDLGGIDGDVARRVDSGSNDDHSSALLKVDKTRLMRREPEVSLTSSSSEETNLSTPWSIIVVLVVAAGGLLWVLLNRRS